MVNTYKIFISHSWEYTNTLESLKKLLNQRGYFAAVFQESTREKPINSNSEAYIKSALRNRINESDIVIGLAGIYASHSDWIAWELNHAAMRGIPIIGVVPRGQQRISQVVSLLAKEIVWWNTESVVSAIRRHAR
ncbi:TIR domain-containing protein [Xanthomonas axonopodis]